MTTSSARPALLIGYATTLRGRVGGCAEPLRRATASVVAFDEASPGYAVGVGPMVMCELLLRDLMALADEVRRTGEAFLEAGSTAIGLETVSTGALTIEPQAGSAALIAVLVPPPQHRIPAPGSLATRSAGGRSGGSEAGEDGGSPGYLGIDAEGSITFGPRFRHEFEIETDDGRLVGSAEAEAFFGLLATGSAAKAAGPVDLEGKFEAGAGVAAGASAKGSIGLDGIEAEAGAGIRAGLHASASTSATLGAATAKASAHGTAGFELGLEAEGSVSLDEVAFEVSGAAAMGLGGGGTFSVSVEPKRAVGSLVDYGRADLEREWSGQPKGRAGPWGGPTPFDRFVDGLKGLLPG